MNLGLDIAGTIDLKVDSTGDSDCFRSKLCHSGHEHTAWNCNERAYVYSKLWNWIDLLKTSLLT